MLTLVGGALGAGLAGGAAITGLHLGSAFLPWPGLHDRLVPGTLWRCPGDGVALTFDDGPDPDWTPLVLDALRDAGALATFFLVGERAARHPDLARRIAGEGHAVGNHGWSHASLVALGSRDIASEIDRCQAALAGLVGATPTLLRPPYGRRDCRVYRAARRRGITPVMWSLDACDWFLGAAGVARRLGRVGPGDIVLLHDGLPRRLAMLGALRGLLGRLGAAGIPVVPLSSGGPR